MEQRDFRGLGRAAQEALRARAVYLVIEAEGGKVRRRQRSVSAGRS